MALRKLVWFSWVALYHLKFIDSGSIFFNPCFIICIDQKKQEEASFLKYILAFYFVHTCMRANSCDGCCNVLVSYIQGICNCLNAYGYCFMGSCYWIIQGNAKSSVT